MIRGSQSIVNAQVHVNRCVHEINNEERADYLIQELDLAIAELRQARRKINTLIYEAKNKRTDKSL